MASNSEEAFSPQRVFEAIDTDKSGLLSRSELELALTVVLGKQVDGKEVDKIMTKFDVNKDGQLGEYD